MLNKTPENKFFKITFTVEGLPPKKDSGKSLWSLNRIKNEKNKVIKKERLKKLRDEAFKCIHSSGVKIQGKEKIKIKIEIFYKKEDENKIGDLDNLAGGVLDGLQAVPKRVNMDKQDMSDLNSDKYIISDDKIVDEICIKRYIYSENFYVVEITFENTYENFSNKI